MADLTIAELDALEKLAEKATPGLLNFKKYNDGYEVFRIIGASSDTLCTVWRMEDAERIAALDPETILRLCAMARKGMGE